MLGSRFSVPGFVVVATMGWNRATDIAASTGLAIGLVAPTVVVLATGNIQAATVVGMLPTAVVVGAVSILTDREATPINTPCTAGDISTGARTDVRIMDGGLLTLGWPSGTGPTRRNDASNERRRTTDRAFSRLRLLVSTVSFWSAIALPALYIPLLLGGLESVARLGLFLSLFGLHVLALIGGRRHHG